MAEALVRELSMAVVLAALLEVRGSAVFAIASAPSSAVSVLAAPLSWPAPAVAGTLAATRLAKNYRNALLVLCLLYFCCSVIETAHATAEHSAVEADCPGETGRAVVSALEEQPFVVPYSAQSLAASVQVASAAIPAAYCSAIPCHSQGGLFGQVAALLSGSQSSQVRSLGNAGSLEDLPCDFDCPVSGQLAIYRHQVPDAGPAGCRVVSHCRTCGITSHHCACRYAR